MRGLAKLAVLSFILAFYVHRCLRKGFSRFSFLRESEKKGVRALPSEKPPSLRIHSNWTGGSIRRLTGGELSLPALSEAYKKDAAEDALCSAIEASTEGSRAAAAQRRAEETGEEALPVLPTERQGVEKGKGYRWITHLVHTVGWQRGDFLVWPGAPASQVCLRFLGLRCRDFWRSDASAFEATCRV